MTEQTTLKVTARELAALMKQTAGVTVDTADLERRIGSGFDAFGLDSLGLLGIVGELEKRYGFVLPEDAEKCKTPADFLKMVNGTLAAGV
jgi:minimal PKS acyl carrier protein